MWISECCAIIIGIMVEDEPLISFIDGLWAFKEYVTISKYIPVLLIIKHHLEYLKITSGIVGFIVDSLQHEIETTY